MSADDLPCGRSRDGLLEQVADGAAVQRDAHQRSCPHCQAALGEYDRLFAPVRALAAEPVPVPDTVLAEVLRRVRGAVPDADYGVLTGPRGVTRVAGRVVSVTARVATEDVPGVRAALARQEPAGATGPPVVEVESGVAGASAAVRVTVAADYGQDLHALAERIRAAVAQAVEEITGLHAVQIDITIDDVLR